MRSMRHMAATAILIALATPAASITFPWPAQQRTPAKACITSAKRGDLVEALGQLEAAREARDPQLCEAWAAVLDGLAAGGSAATLRFFEAMLHDGLELSTEQMTERVAECVGRG